MRTPFAAHCVHAIHYTFIALPLALPLFQCDARSYDASCVANETSTSVEGSPCSRDQVGLVSCALPDADTCTPRSSTVVECTEPASGSGSPTWQSVYACADGQICYFLQPTDGAPPISNAVGCGVNNYPISRQGLPCNAAGSQACDFDGTDVLSCDGTSWTVAQSCSGSTACGGVALSSTCNPNSPYCVGCQ